jgi:hypothetical protein
MSTSVREPLAEAAKAADLPPSPSPEENCVTNSKAFYKNSSDGNCLFEAVAQVYHNINYNDPGYNKVKKTGNLLRQKLADVYRNATLTKKDDRQALSDSRKGN